MVIEKKEESHSGLFKKENKPLDFSDSSVRRAFLVGLGVGVILSVLAAYLFVV